MKRVYLGDESLCFPRAWIGVGVWQVFLAGLIGLAVWAVSRKVEGQSAYEYELPPIEYSTSTASNQLTCLMRNWGGEGHPMPSGSRKEFLGAFLQRMSVPAASQMLVFSKTSLQRDLIRPDQPRALYFSDDCYIGWVPGGLVEVVVSDPDLGVVFYSLDPRKTNGPPEVKRGSRVSFLPWRIDDPGLARVGGTFDLSRRPGESDHRGGRFFDWP